MGYLFYNQLVVTQPAINNNCYDKRDIKIIIIIIIIINFPETRKYWIDVQRGIVLSHGERGTL